MSTTEKSPPEDPTEPLKIAVRVVEMELMRMPSIARLKPNRRNAMAAQIMARLEASNVVHIGHSPVPHQQAQLPRKG